MENVILTIGILKFIYSKHVFRARGQKSQMFICVTAKTSRLDSKFSQQMLTFEFTKLGSLSYIIHVCCVFAVSQQNGAQSYVGSTILKDVENETARNQVYYIRSNLTRYVPVVYWAGLLLRRLTKLNS